MKILKKIIKIILILISLLVLLVLIVNFYVINREKNKIYSSDNIDKKYDIALVLGCSVHKDGSPSKMLKDRLDAAIYLYENNLVENILVSGDHSNSYSEVLTMKDYLINHNVLESNILLDYRGFNTSKSIKNYNEYYKDKTVIIVSQKYHLYRALLIADRLKLNAIGIHAELINYPGQIFREIREILARNKDFFLIQ